MAWILLVFAGVFEMLGINFLNAYVHHRQWDSFSFLL